MPTMKYAVFVRSELVTSFSHIDLYTICIEPRDSSQINKDSNK